MMRLFVLVAALAVFVCGVSAQTCLDERGFPVDWWTAIKMPRYEDNTSGGTGIQNGTAYIYGDANTYQTPYSFWTQSVHYITDQDGAPGYTINQIYQNATNSEVGYVMYNDEVPNGPFSKTYGHTKGHISWGLDGGFWLIHSVPKLAAGPGNASAYEYPHTGQMYGQSMLCVSLSVSQIDLAFLQFQFTNPQVYASQWVTALTAAMPNGDAFLNNQKVDVASGSNIVNITTLGGMSFTHFAKTSKWGESIFGNLIGPYYGQAMIVETWQRPYQLPLLPPNSTEPVYSVRNLQAPNSQFGSFTWDDQHDHSKWGVMVNKYPVTCIGDINKQRSQWIRSGGMMCIQDKVISGAYNSLIAVTDQNTVEEIVDSAVATY